MNKGFHITLKTPSPIHVQEAFMRDNIILLLAVTQQCHLQFVRHIFHNKYSLYNKIFLYLL